jgi:Glycosyl transferases group 1
VRILLWHVHGSWTTSFVAGGHEYLVPVTPDRGPDGRGRAQTWTWPDSVVEVPLDEVGRCAPDLVVLQRPHEASLLAEHGLRVGTDVPAVYVEHNAPPGHAVSTVHPVVEQPELAGIPVVHVTRFNAMAWDCGRAPTRVVDHGIPDPGHLYTGEDAALAVVVNEPVRRWRVAGTDLLLSLSEHVPLRVYGMGTDQLAAAADRAGHRPLDLRVDDLSQDAMHRAMAHQRAYLHPYRWTSLGLSLLEAMTAGLPVLALSTTEAPAAVPPEAGVVSNDLELLRRTALRWLADPEEARDRGLAARRHALDHYGLARFLDDWDLVLKEVTQ